MPFILDRSTNGSAVHNDHATNGQACVSPLRPLRQAHRNEREQMCSLNDRLAHYIDRVRELENERWRLQQRVDATSGATGREVDAIRTAFTLELGDARRLQQQVVAEKQQLATDSQRFKLTAEELSKKLSELEQNVEASKDEGFKQEHLAQELTMKLNSVHRRKRCYDAEGEVLTREKETLSKKLAEVNLLLEDERAKSCLVKAELHSASEDAFSKRSFFEKTLNETRVEINDFLIEQLEINLDSEYCFKLQKSLSEMRDELDATIQQNRLEMAKTYESKMRELQSKSVDDRNEESKNISELQNLLHQKSSVESASKDWENKLKQLENDCETLKSGLETRSFDFNKKLVSRDEQSQRLRNEIQKMVVNYHDLMDTKILLTKEIDTYRSLLEGEEKRLQISPKIESSVNGRTFKKAKRTKLITSKFITKTGGRPDVLISNLECGDVFIKIENVSEKDLPIGNWILKCESDLKEMAYKFHNKIVLKAKSVITIYNCDSQVVHDPPCTLVMKSQKWIIYEKCHVSLTDADGKVVSWGELVHEHVAGSNGDAAVNGIAPATTASVGKVCSVM